MAKANRIEENEEENFFLQEPIKEDNVNKSETVRPEQQKQMTLIFGGGIAFS